MAKLHRDDKWGVFFHSLVYDIEKNADKQYDRW